MRQRLAWARNFISRQRLAKTTRFHVEEKYFLSQKGVAKTKGALCCDKSNCVVTEFGQAKSFLVATECFFFVTELTMGERLYVAKETFMS